MRELDLSTRIFRDYNDANRHFKHIEMDNSIVNRYNEELSHETSKLSHPMSAHSIDSQSYHHMHSHFTPLAIKTDSSQPTHYFWPAIVANSQIHHSQSHSPISEAPSSPNSVSVISLRKKKRKATPIPNESKDEAYWERRKKNNESAKRSREIRRLKEQQTNSRVVFLEQENLKLKAEVETLREEIGKLRELFFNNRRRIGDVDQ